MKFQGGDTARSMQNKQKIKAWTLPLLASENSGKQWKIVENGGSVLILEKSKKKYSAEFFPNFENNFG